MSSLVRQLWRRFPKDTLLIIGSTTRFVQASLQFVHLLITYEILCLNNQSPITRFLAKYFLYDKSLDYETHVSRLTEESEIMILRKIERELKVMMATKSDNKAWYYLAANYDDDRFSNEWEATEPFRYDGVPEAGNPPENQMARW